MRDSTVNGRPQVPILQSYSVASCILASRYGRTLIEPLQVSCASGSRETLLALCGKSLGVGVEEGGDKILHHILF